MEYKRNILITGGAGFIGSHLVRLFVQKYSTYRIINFDALTYAGNLKNLSDIENKDNYVFVKGDICNVNDLNSVFDSTDEVYGSLHNDKDFFLETTAYDPQSPYSASKASSDHFVRAYRNTYGLKTVISNCSNNYGQNQFPEKLIPLCLNNIKNNKPLPIYGKGDNIRDWLYVADHARAIDVVFHKGIDGETYNIGGWNEWTNLDLVKLLCKVMDKKLNRAIGTSEKLITFVKDRAGHDVRYAIDASKIKDELGWEPSLQFEEGLSKTVDWYLENEQWLNDVVSGEYQSYYEQQYY